MTTGGAAVIRLHDVTAREDSAPSCGDAQSFSPAEALREPVRLPIPDCATLEQDFFRLDGSFQPFPDRPEGRGWGLWSVQMSGGDCRFALPPILRVAFSKSHSSVGLTLYFYEREQDYCRHLRVRWLDAGGNLMTAKDFFPTGPAPFLSHKAEHYYGLEILFLETAKPFRFLKLSGLDYGTELWFGPEEISSAVILEEADPQAATVSVNTLDLTLHCAGAEFSPLNPRGMFPALQQKQRLEAYALRDGARQEMGSFYLQSWESDEKDNLRLHAVDAVGLMDQVTHRGGVYEDAPLTEVLEGLFALTDGAFTLDSSLAGCHLRGYLPMGTARQALGQIAFAAGALVDCSRSDAVKLYPLPVRPSTLILPSRKLAGQRVRQRPYVTGIDLVAHRFLPVEERYAPFSQRLEAGEYTVIFAEPTHSPAVTGASLWAAGANFVTLRVTEPGEVEVTGGRYRHERQLISENLVTRVANPAENRMKVENATLIHTGNAKALMGRLRDCCGRELSSEFSLALGEERVADMVMVKDGKGQSVKGVVESVEVDLTKGCIARLRIAAEPMETTNSSYTGELYAGDETGVL